MASQGSCPVTFQAQKCHRPVMGEAGSSSWGERQPAQQPALSAELESGLGIWDSAQPRLSVRQMGR